MRDPKFVYSMQELVELTGIPPASISRMANAHEDVVCIRSAEGTYFHIEFAKYLVSKKLRVAGSELKAKYRKYKKKIKDPTFYLNRDYLKVANQISYLTIKLGAAVGKDEKRVLKQEIAALMKSAVVVRRPK